MIERLTITVLVENTAGSRGLLGEHGIAFHVQADDFTLLFDTGQGMVLRHNANALGIDLNAVRTIALSHGHYDHTGALPELLGEGPKRRLFLHPAALRAKYNRRHEAIGSGLPERDVLTGIADVTWTSNPTWLAPSIWVTGEIPRNSAFEDTGGPFYLDATEPTPDPLADDQALVIDTVAGLVVVLGCGHAGVVNTLAFVRSVQERPIHALIGGMHLVRAEPDRLAATANALADFDVRWLVPMHCTGIQATSLLWTRFPDRCLVGSVGARLVFGRDPG